MKQHKTIIVPIGVGLLVAGVMTALWFGAATLYGWPGAVVACDDNLVARYSDSVTATTTAEYGARLGAAAAAAEAAMLYQYDPSCTYILASAAVYREDAQKARRFGDLLLASERRGRKPHEELVRRLSTQQLGERISQLEEAMSRIGGDRG